MSGQAKRLCLIKSGAEVRRLQRPAGRAPAVLMDTLTAALCAIRQTIPKRRYGEQELELALLPFLDETVRFEARLALAMEGTTTGCNPVPTTRYAG